MKKYLILTLTVFAMTLLGLQTIADEPSKVDKPVLQENCAINPELNGKINDSEKERSSDDEYVRHIRCNCYKYDQSGCRKYGNLDEKWTKYNNNDDSKSEKARTDK